MQHTAISHHARCARHKLSLLAAPAVPADLCAHRTLKIGRATPPAIASKAEAPSRVASWHNCITSASKSSMACNTRGTWLCCRPPGFRLRAEPESRGPSFCNQAHSRTAGSNLTMQVSTTLYSAGHLRDNLHMLFHQSNVWAANIAKGAHISMVSTFHRPPPLPL